MSASVILMRTVWTQPSQTTAFEFRLSNYFFPFFLLSANSSQNKIFCKIFNFLSVNSAENKIVGLDNYWSRCIFGRHAGG